MTYFNNNYNANSQNSSNSNISNKWSVLSYSGEQRVPQGEEVMASSWPLAFLKRDLNNTFTTPNGDILPCDIKEPDLAFKLAKEFAHVVDVQKNLTPQQVKIAKYWNDGPPTKQIMPIADILIDTYSVPACRAARILYVLNGALNDTIVVCWYYKYKWDVLRPCQYDQNFKPLLCTPKHPTYPAGHACLAGCMAEILSYFFPSEREKLFILANECCDSRVYAGVHFNLDCIEGLKLGVCIAKAIIKDIVYDCNKNGVKIDTPYTDFRDANIFPKDYTQYIPYNRTSVCTSATLGDIIL